MALLSSDSAYGSPNTDNYLLGRGSIYFDLYDKDLNVALGQFRNLGNSTEFALNITEEELEHQSSRSGLKITDSSVSLSKELAGSFTLDEIHEENLAAFLSGTIDESYTQSAVAVATAASYIAKYNNSGTLATARGSDLAGRWIELYNAGGTQRIYNLTTVSGVHPTGAPGTVGVLGTDYKVDLKLGLLFIVPGGVLDTSATIDVEYTAVDATTRKDVIVFDRSVVRAAIVFKSINAQTDEVREVRLHKCKITAEGDLSVIGDDWATMQFNFTAETDTANHPTSPTGYIRGFSY